MNSATEFDELLLHPDIHGLPPFNPLLTALCGDAVESRETARGWLVAAATARRANMLPLG